MHAFIIYTFKLKHVLVTLEPSLASDKNNTKNILTLGSSKLGMHLGDNLSFYLSFFPHVTQFCEISA